MAEDVGRGVRPLVVKVGGSLAETGRLKSALEMISAARVPLVVVPGGGPFADAVRNLQKEMRFDDAVAHRLAMLAMHQMAEFIVSQQPGAKVVQSVSEVFDVVMEGQIPVWAPLQMIGDDALVPAGWGATSDSLAARLAEILAAPLALLKSVDVEQGASAEDLAQAGVVDSVFPVIVARARLSWSIFGPKREAALAALLAGEGGI